MFGSGGPAGKILVSIFQFIADRIEFHGNLQLWVSNVTLDSPLDSTIFFKIVKDVRTPRNRRDNLQNSMEGSSVLLEEEDV